MNVIPDRVLMVALKEGLQTFRSNPKMLAVLYQNLTDPEFNDMLALLKQAINFSFNIPRKEITPPTICVTLKSERESIQFLGDHMGTSPGWGLTPPEHTIDTLTGHSASQSTMEGLGKKLAGPLRVETSTPTTIYLNDIKYTEAKAMGLLVIPTGGAVEVHVVSGTGRGKVLSVQAFGETRIDIIGEIGVLLDTTSRIDIREKDTLLLTGEPVRVYNEDAVLSRKGAYYGANYTLDIIAGSQEQVIYLYILVRSILFLFKGSLEAQGLQNLVISGSDLTNKAAFVPDELFHRAMNLEFTYPASILIEEEVLSAVELCMSANGGEHIPMTTIQFETEDTDD